MNPIVAIIQDTRYEKKNGKYPVKLRITFRRRQYYLPINLDLTKQDFLEATNAKVKKEYRPIHNAIELANRKAMNIVDDMVIFNFDDFKKRWGRPARSASDVYTFFQDYITILKTEERLGTASSYECSLRSMQLFSTHLAFSDINENLLNRYEDWMLKRGNSTTTIGIYLRNLRAIFNKAIDDGFIIKDSNYPFGKRKYVIPASKNTKKALSLEEIKKIVSHKVLPNTAEAFAKEIWYFSYLCNGMNIKDIALLVNRNIDSDFLRFRRAKTERSTKGNQCHISAYLPEPAVAIINAWRVNSGPDDFIFPIISNDMSAAEKRAAIQQATKQINKYMQRIAEAVGISKKVTTYTSRHSYATILKRSGASLEYISESLGHSSLKTTQSYLDSFENEMKIKMAAHLLNF